MEHFVRNDEQEVCCHQPVSQSVFGIVATKSLDQSLDPGVSHPNGGADGYAQHQSKTTARGVQRDAQEDRNSD
ncbi:hypothetical protein [Mariniblastus fucicola]|uniref:hypothetical protein n=1 Tax=Mariniblastus fucicola TaxID=980251 RepID=UPI0009463BB1|nr:hypothetical protein [Mariniblastus fucicola]